jgi:hypothetical protein
VVNASPWFIVNALGVEALYTSYYWCTVLGIFVATITNSMVIFLWWGGCDLRLSGIVVCDIQRGGMMFDRHNMRMLPLKIEMVETWWADGVHGGARGSTANVWLKWIKLLIVMRSYSLQLFLSMIKIWQHFVFQLLWQRARLCLVFQLFLLMIKIWQHFNCYCFCQWLKEHHSHRQTIWENLLIVMTNYRKADWLRFQICGNAQK